MMEKHIIQTRLYWPRNAGVLFLLAGIMTLAACAGTEKTANVSASRSPAESPAAPAVKPAVPSPSVRKETPVTRDTVPVSSESVFPDTQKPSAVSMKDTKKPEENSVQEPDVSRADVYRDIPRIAERALDHADSLISAGNLVAADTILEQFSVLKPLWQEWLDRAGQLENKIDAQRKSRKTALRPLALQIINMNAIGAPYAEVRALTDSLIALAPGDSLTTWARTQAALAYHRTYAKLEEETQRALDSAREQGAFDAAEKTITGIMNRFEDFSDTLQLQSALLSISDMRLEESDADVSYWKTHDAALAMQQARQSITGGRYLEAKKVLTRLKASSLRASAVAALDSLGEQYCTEERTQASVLFSQARKNPAQSRKFLSQAVAALDRCLKEFPENRQRVKVRENREFLQKELEP